MRRGKRRKKETNDYTIPVFVKFPNKQINGMEGTKTCSLISSTSKKKASLKQSSLAKVKVIYFARRNLTSTNGSKLSALSVYTQSSFICYIWNYF